MALDPLQSTFRADGETIGNNPACSRGLLWVYPEQKFTAFGQKSQRLGRGDDCDVQLPGTEVSRHHAELFGRGPVSYVADLKSTNGTFHNGVRLGPESAGLADQDVVRVGEWVGVVCTIPDGATPRVDYVGELIAGPQTQELLQRATQIAASDLPVILLGESGTGKELFSRCIHTRSARAGELVAVNCAALPESLAEAELFGHKKGAFTGADGASTGYVRAADGGTLLLDEIGDLPLSIQAKLLRVIEESQVVPLGTSSPIRVDVRFIAAGQQSLAGAVGQERFRGDLYARLNGIELRLPPLRERREEVLPVFVRVAQRQLGEAKLPRLSPQMVERLCMLPWAFNVRQLVQVARQMAVLHASEPEWTIELLPASVEEKLKGRSGKETASKAVSSHSALGTDSAEARGTMPTLQERREQARDKELQELQEALDQCDGNVSEAARVVGISRRKAYRLLKRTEPESQ